MQFISRKRTKEISCSLLLSFALINKRKYSKKFCLIESFSKIIANALKKCILNANRLGKKFSLQTFIAGRNRLEADGAVALAGLFQVNVYLVSQLKMN